MENLELQIDCETKLKLLQTDDAGTLFKLVDSNREHLRSWLPWVDANKTLTDSAAFIGSAMEKFRANNGFELAIWFKGELAGLIGLQINKTNRRANIGYWLGEQFQGNGLAIRATMEVTKYAFEKLNIHRLVIQCAVGNEKSQVIPQKLGFRLEGIEREGEWLYDHFVDLQTYSMLEQEYSDGALKSD